MNVKKYFNIERSIVINQEEKDGKSLETLKAIKLLKREGN